MLTRSKILRHTCSALAIAFASLASYAAPLTTQLGFLIDASGSIGTQNFNTMRSGYATALAALPTDGSIELTVVTFASGTATVVAAMGGNIIVKIKESRVAISEEMARKIMI